MVKAENKLLDFLFEVLPEKSRNKVKSYLKHGQIRVDGEVKTRHDTELAAGQTVSLSRVGQLAAEAASALDIIYEDDELLVINKPHGLLSVGNESEKALTAYRAAMNYVRLKHPQNRIFIVHRLDKDTSGVLLFAKTEEMKLLLQKNWDRIAVRRGYVAVVEGISKAKEGTIRTWLNENSIHKVYSAREGEGVEAITNFAVARECRDYSLMKLDIKTGRKNQIRVHMAENGTPVAGDKKYGAKTNPLRRVCLHADELAIKHPKTGELMRFKANTPRRFAGLVKHGK